MISIDVEEWYHSQWFDADTILKSGNPPSSCEEDVDSVLGLCNELGFSATFFVLGEVAEKHPNVIERIVAEGHEIGCHGYRHSSIQDMGGDVFKTQLKGASKLLSQLSGEETLGYRAPNFRITTEAINILEKTGFRYDSSIVPCLPIPGWYGHPRAPVTPYLPSRRDMCVPVSGRKFWEVPIAVSPVLRAPGGGGWYVRNIGFWWTKTIIRSLLKRGPATVYFHSWEVSDKNPRLLGIPFHVFTRTGRCVRDRIKSLVRSVDANVVTIRELLTL